ncbi:tRNA-dihydrouridine synthase [Olsenella sp. Marseille-P4559]|uniref:tRNA dihydrouridine synthase n=1 Tax=Olsenella sp. Marseille-P4559 TaxID=2364795 RepID=UPI0010300342|nr:tRNA-dihydrouridine synthase [Olsenella sp. Marseille-P4559]
MTPSQVLAEWGPTAGLLGELPPVPMAAGGLGLKSRLGNNPLLMAPMAGVSDAAYRTMARAGGAGLAYTEMVSCAGLHFGGEKTWELVDPAETEYDVAVQLFGSKPEFFREAAASVVERLGDRLALIDVNMACPVPKVTKKGEGSALLDDLGLSGRLVRACIEGTGGAVPVTVKIRRGRRMGEEVAPDFARAMEDAGASAIAVHGRFANQLYHGEADWDCVRRVADAVSVPVIGSGDVSSASAAARMLSETGVGAVMIARGSYGNPWIFGDAAAILAGEGPRVHDSREKIAAFRCHVRLLAATSAHLKRARSLAGWYLRGMPEAARVRGMAVTCRTLDDYLAVADAAERMLQDA